LNNSLTIVQEWCNKRSTIV